MCIFYIWSHCLHLFQEEAEKYLEIPTPHCLPQSLEMLLTFFSWCGGLYRMSWAAEWTNPSWHVGGAPLDQNGMAGVTDPHRLWWGGQGQLIVRAGIAENLPTVPTVMLKHRQRMKNGNLQWKSTWELDTNKQYTQNNPKGNSWLLLGVSLQKKMDLHPKL